MENIFTKKKNSYQKKLSVYIKRRNELISRKKHLNYKIAQFKVAIKNIENNQIAIMNLLKDVENFTGIKLSTERGSRKLSLAKGLYFKYGLENKMKATHLGRMIGATSKDIPSRSRRYFTRSMEKSAENRQIWYNFKEFVKNQGR